MHIIGPTCGRVWARAATKWIGNHELDRKITYPDQRFLSRLAFPIQNVQPSPSQAKDAAMQTPREQFRSTWPRTEALPPHITRRLETHALTSCTIFCT